MQILKHSPQIQLFKSEIVSFWQSYFPKHSNHSITHPMRYWAFQILYNKHLNTNIIAFTCHAKMAGSTILLYSDFAYTEADVKRFFSFCGEILNITLKFTPETIANTFISEVTFKGSADSALLLDGGVFMGHIFKIEKCESSNTQSDEKTTLMEKIKQVPFQVTSNAKKINDKYQITKKTKKALFALPGFLMRPCMKQNNGPKIQFGSQGNDLQ